MNYEDDIRIDEEMLDLEWTEQPLKMLKYCSILAKALKEVDVKKQELDIVKADIDKAVRTSPETFGLGKVTEATVEFTVIRQAEYVAANNSLIEAKYEMEMAKAAVRAMDQRKDALEGMVRLYIAGYFAGPSVPHVLADEKNKWKKVPVEIKAPVKPVMQRTR
jgi:hypothetical protein